MEQQNSTVEIFCCYAHEDEDLLNKLKRHLSPLRRQSLIDVWHDGDISAGAEWEQEIKKHLNEAHIILLLISPDFIHSDYCYDTEMKRAWERHEQKEATVIPIIVRAVAWQDTPIGNSKLGRLQSLPKSAKPVTTWENCDEAWENVTQGISRVANKLRITEPVLSIETRSPQHRISRRMIIIGLGGLGGLGAAGRYVYSKVVSNYGVQATATAKAVPTTMVNKTTYNYNTYVSQYGIMFGFDTQHTRNNPYEHILNVGNVSQLRLAWSASTGDQIRSSPAVANGMVYVGSTDQKLYAFDVVTGQQKWAAPTGNYIYNSSSPAVANGVVYVGSRDQKLYAFDAVTGQQKWAAPTGASVVSSPAVANGLVYVGSYDHNLYAFDVVTGQQKWVAPTGNYIYNSSPAVANGLIYIGSADQKLYAFDAITGQQKWAAPTSAGVFSSPAVANGVVYVGSYDHKFYAFDAVTGQQKWTAPTGDIVDSSPAVANGVVYVGSYDHNLYAFDATTGQQKWIVFTGSSIFSSPAVANGVVYVGSYDHNLYAFDAVTGQQKWAAPTGDIIPSSPAVANGVVYVGSYDHKLYAFSLENPA